MSSGAECSGSRTLARAPHGLLTACPVGLGGRPFPRWKLRCGITQPSTHHRARVNPQGLSWFDRLDDNPTEAGFIGPARDAMNKAKVSPSRLAGDCVLRLEASADVGVKKLQSVSLLVAGFGGTLGAKVTRIARIRALPDATYWTWL